PNEDAVAEPHPASLQRNVNVVIELLGGLAAAAAPGWHALRHYPHDPVEMLSDANRLPQGIVVRKKILGDFGTQDCNIEHLVVVIINQKSAGSRLEFIDGRILRRGGDQATIPHMLQSPDLLRENPHGDA